MNILMQRNDPGRTGVNAAEAALRPDRVNVNSFGKLHATALNRGAVYAQPLYVAGLDFGPPLGKRDAVFVATMGNSVFAVDANTGAVLRQVHVDNRNPVASHTYFGGTYNDIVQPGGAEPTIGILSTPAIDLAAREMILVLFTVDDAKAKAPQAAAAARLQAFQYLLCVLDLTTLQTKRTAVIAGSVSGTGYRNSGLARPNAPAGEVVVQTPLLPGQVGTIDVVDATGIGTPDPRVHFNAMMQLQRPGLLLHDGAVLVAFGSRGDMNPYHGWVFAYRTADLTLLDLFCTTPNGGQGGIWQAGQGIIADAQGNLYAGTGNGASRQPTSGEPGTPNAGESFLKLRLDNGRLNLVGWYNAFNDLDYQPVTGPGGGVNEEVRAKDDDLGASAPSMLPDGRIVGGGKDGYFYLIDADELIGDAAQRQEAPKADNVVLQYFLGAYNFARGTRRVPTFLDPDLRQEEATHHIHGAPVVWQPAPNRTLVYVWGENDVARAYRYVPRQPNQPLSGGFPDQGAISVAPLITSNWQGVIPLPGVDTARGTYVASNEDRNRGGMPGGVLSLSWDGQDPGSAILWACVPPFDNGNLKQVAGELIAYDASAFEPQLNFSRMRAVWRSRQNPADDFGPLAKFCCPSVADGKVFVPAGDGSALFIYGLKAGGNPTAGGYNLARDARTPAFGGAAGLTLNGSANVGQPLPDKRVPVVLTQNPVLGGSPTFLAGSVFATNPVDVTTLRTTFTVQLDAPDRNNMADGFTFTVQAAGPNALGSAGSGLGYALDPLDGTGTGARIPRSLALAFSVVTNTVALWRDGAGGGPALHDLGTNGIALNSGHPIRVVIDCASAARTLRLTVSDTVTQNSTGPLVVNNVDIPGFLKLGTPAQAFIGFTAGTGIKSAEQKILDWSIP